MVELRQLQYFLAVAEQLNFSKAAKLLYVTQPLLSQQISELEKQLNVVLFERNRRSVSLTPAGMALAKEAHIIMGRVNNLNSVVSRAVGGEGLDLTLHIGFEHHFERTRLTQACLEFHQKNPNFHSNMVSYSYGGLMKALNEGEVDLGFTFLPNPAIQEDLIKIPIWKDYLTIVASAKKYGQMERKEFLSKADQITLLLLDQDPRGLNHVLELCRKLRISSQIQLMRDANEILMNVEVGSGFTILPYNFVETFHSGYVCTFSLEDYSEAELELTAVQNRRNQNPVTNLFLNFLQNA